MQINDRSFTSKPQKQFALFHLGFRAFFFGAAGISIISLTLWTLVLQFGLSINLTKISSFQWHAHEMIFGYSLAVISGFLLTAVKNWTAVETPQGKSLALLFTIWLIARVLWMFGSTHLAITAVFDILYSVLLVTAVSYPIIKAKQWNQLFLLSKLILLLIFNGLFYLAALNIVNIDINFGLYGGLYLVIAIIFNMGRRVVPFFIEKGVGYSVKVVNRQWLDVSIAVLFTGFVVSELVIKHPWVSASFAIGVFLLNAIRLIGWYTKGIWKKSLLWSIYLAFWFFTIGFFMFAIHYFLGFPKNLAIHLMTVGGIALFTVGMMSRISLGHTGRDIAKPPSGVKFALGILVLAVISRVFIPLVDMADYQLWIGLSQLLWVVSFLIFMVVYLPIFIKPREPQIK